MADNDLQKRIAQLSPEKRALLLQRLNQLPPEVTALEAALNAHPALQQAAVSWARETDPAQTETRLVAYLVARPPHPPTTGPLRRFLHARLPTALLPQLYVFLERLPLLPNGALDRAALPSLTEAKQRLAHSTFSTAVDRFEKQLTAIWEAVLDVRPISLTDHFFDLGGDVTLAVQLSAHLSEHLHRPVPPDLFSQNCTLQQCVTTLRQETPVTETSTLVALQAQGSKRPFFCVHPVGNDVLGFIDLAQCLEPDQPFYGLKYIKSAPNHITCLSAEARAAQYVAAVRAQQPTGPYLLGGLCYGGFIAFEMAQQLHQAGERVALLALFEAWPLRVRNQCAMGFDATGALIKIAEAVAEQHGQTLPLAAASLAALPPDEQVAHIVAQMTAAGLLPTAAEQDQMRQDLQTYYGSTWTLHTYRPQVYPGRLTFFRARTLNPEQLDYSFFAQHPALNDPARGWHEFTTEPVEVYEAPGDHVTMMLQPHVPVLARQLTACLHRAQARA